MDMELCHEGKRIGVLNKTFSELDLKPGEMTPFIGAFRYASRRGAMGLIYLVGE